MLFVAAIVPDQCSVEWHGKNTLNKRDNYLLLICVQMLIKQEVAFVFCRASWILADQAGSRHWSGFSSLWSNRCVSSRRKNNRHHLDKGDEFIVHSNDEEWGLVCFSRCLTLLINNCKAKWNVFTADDKVVGMKMSLGIGEDNGSGRRFITGDLWLMYL